MQMRKILLFSIIITSLCGVSCKKYLNINTNPNAPTVTNSALELPQALVNTALLVSQMNDYGGQTVGYSANAGGYGGFGASWTYDYPPSQGETFWDEGYQYLENYQYIINSAATTPANANFAAVARIMKAYVFEMLVDEFGDIPYSQALQGGANFRPKYDSAATIYPALASLIDSAITEINGATSATAIPSSSDPLFQGNMTQWKQFGNSLKLRLIVRASAATTFSNTTFSADGFLQTDAIVQPGYALAQTGSGSQVNPSWTAWVTNYAGSKSNSAWVPAYFVYGFYDGTKLSDPVRGAAVYFGWPLDSLNQLGVTPPNNTKTSPAVAGAWYSGTGSGTSLGNAKGVEKGPNMGEPLMLLAESEFLQAEADVRGILSGNAQTDFNNGIAASFYYLEQGPSLTSWGEATGPTPLDVTDATAYQAANSTSYLANFNLATTTAEKIEAIITQKYIALNFINGEEAWSEYRRTGYPVSSPLVINNPYGSMASTQSQATRPDHLPTRLPYPSSEAATNASNVPQGVSIYTTPIFWAQ
jgi:Starch-binding associating with outer membrane